MKTNQRSWHYRRLAVPNTLGVCHRPHPIITTIRFDLDVMKTCLIGL